MPFEIVVTDTPDPPSREPILPALMAFNEQAVGPAEFRPLGVLAKAVDGKTLGGLTGWTGWQWLFVQLFWLPEELRGAGLGSELLRRAEAEAMRRGCRAAWLDSFSFQAPEFYRRQGYEIFGVLDDYPPGHRRVFLKKTLV